LASSVYSETACAVAVRVAELGYVPSGALALSTLNPGTLLRKLGQWGPREVARYARAKLIPHSGAAQGSLRNEYLDPWLERGDKYFRSLREVGKSYDFPIALCHDQNATKSITLLREWAPDLIIFAGGNILKRPLLAVPRFGVLNVHLGLLPEIRGMSSPEWSLLNDVPVGITNHYMDAGIDTGPILQRLEFPDAKRCGSLSELRHRLIAFGIQQIGNVISALDRGALSPAPQPEQDKDQQFYVMHELLQARAAERLARLVHG
jgi:folate-dependent phosphoribosylglycinamide formyltransferase PurN